ncbi:YrhC family protein [Anaerobacillus sp. CMMVII]|uniref:YrhC family protein n=1 Tax=Anaerobacillus sp. CMMVII TaxID=2755588 RepID=UPI0021B7AF53|nr:YrhC family protein [Anaerobacillus sp. CMMVII]MCT8139577.1 YrhC family protein [Anaerobacillus sp. CMMVII]
MADKTTNVTKILEDKIADYKRFAFILLALTIFLFLGLIVPNEGVSQNQQLVLIGLSISSLILAAVFHKKAMKYKEQLYSEEN